MIKFPSDDKNWVQTNNSDILGNIWTGVGLDLSENVGRIRLGKRILLNTSTVNVPTITGYPVKFIVCGSNVYTAAGASGTGYAFYSSTTNPLTGTFTKDTDANAPTTIDSTTSDMVFSNNAMYVTCALAGNVEVHKKIGNNAWSKFSSTVASGTYANMLCSYAGRTYMSTNQSTIISWDSADTISTSGANTLTLNTAGDFTTVITKMIPASNRIWILTVNTNSGQGKIYDWDGVSNQATNIYVLSSSGALSGVIKDDAPYVMDSNGNLLVWNGGAFKIVESLNRVNNKLLYNPISLVNDRFIHPNGMDVIKDKINIFIDGRNYDNTFSLEETIPTGVWEYDEKRCLVHKYPISTNKSTDTLTDFGQLRIKGAGALSSVNLPSTSSTRNGTFMLGATFYTDATSTSSGMFYDDSNDTIQKSGYFITPKILSQNVTDAWQSLFYKNKLLSSGDKMVVKYRTSQYAPTEMQITWTSLNTFTTTDANMANYAVGDEVEITQGVGGMFLSHISVLPAPVTGTYTVTVDQTYVGASGTAKARFSKWSKMTTSDSSTSSSPNFSNIQVPMAGTSTWIQFKIWMLFTGKEEFEEFLLQSKVSQTANK